MQIEQQGNQLLISFPTPEAAQEFAGYLETLRALAKVTNYLAPAISDPPSGQSQTKPPDSSEPGRSRHTILTDERLDQLTKQREQGNTEHQRLLRAQTTLRDGVLPFSKPGQPPAPTNQPSPRMRAQAEGGFADGAPADPIAPAGSIAPQERKSRLRLASKGSPQ